MATYNGERYLREQIDSILAQTISFDELIICDDASTDRTCAIVSEYAAKDSRIKLYRNDCNLGFLKNFEKALSLCSADFIALSDQDDIWLPRHLEILLEGIGNKMLAVSDAEVVDSQGYTSGKLLSYYANLNWMPENDLQKAYYLFFYRCAYLGAAMLMKKDLIQKALPIPSTIKSHDLWLISLSCFYGGFNRIKESTMLYRRHSRNVTHVEKKKTRIRTFIGHLLFNRAIKNRPELISAIRTILKTQLNQDQIEFLDNAENYYKRQNSLWGRIRNSMFEIKHYKLIYSK